MVSDRWDTSLSIGYRFAEYEEGATLRRDAMELATVRTRYIGNGITGSAGIRRQVTNRLSFMANGRTSLLLGSQDLTSTGVSLPPNPLVESFDARYILESQLAASYEHRFCNGGFWFVRGGYEIQYWNDFVFPIGDQTRPSSTVFSGLFAAIGLQR